MQRAWAACASTELNFSVHRSPVTSSATSVSTAVSKYLRFWSPCTLSNKSLHSKKLSHQYLVLKAYFDINHRNHVSPCSHYAKFCLLCKKICRQETISSHNNFFFTYQNFLRCHQISNMPSRRFGGLQGFLSVDKILVFVGTAILRRII